MATPQEKLAESLEALKVLQDRHVAAIRTRDLSRPHRERLMRSGFLREVMKGWYIPARPGGQDGDSTDWYASFWDFCAAYLRQRFNEDWCLSPEQSLLVHGGNRAVPVQLIVRTPKGGNKPVALLHGTSIFEMRLAMPRSQDVVEDQNLRLFSLPAALIAASAAFFSRHPTDARTALAALADPSALVRHLLQGGHTTIAGRIAGALRNIGRGRIADDIVGGMKAAGYEVREQDPFENRIEPGFSALERSPYANRIRLMWRQMRDAANGNFPEAPSRPNDIDAYIERVEDIYVTDAYHSLSIEGYRVGADLIERVRSGTWNPDASGEDRAHVDALAARGYWQTFQAVKKSVRAVLQNENPGVVIDRDHSVWYREMFASSVTAGILRPENLAGYRGSQVFIRHSKHVPPPPHAIADAMQVFFEMLQAEENPTVRIVLGHFVFVYIHPYMDGNGRMGRFLMNVMLAAGGYPWTVVPIDRRDDYMTALEQASVQQNIAPFAQFLGGLVRDGFAGKTKANVPEHRP